MQGRTDSLATAHQPEALAHPARPGGATSSAAPDRLQLRAASWPHAGRIGSSRPVRPCDVGKKGTPAPGAAKDDGLGTACVVGVHPVHHRVSPPARAHGHLGGAAALGDVKPELDTTFY